MADAKLLSIKKEVVYGTGPGLVPADVVWAENVKWSNKGERTMAEVARPSLGPIGGYMTGIHGELTFDTPLAGSPTGGAAPPAWGKILKACGWSEVIYSAQVVYLIADIALGGDSLFVTWREGTRLQALYGARGMVGIKLSERQRPMLSVTLRGIKQPAGTYPRPTGQDTDFTGWQDAAPISPGLTTFTIGPFSPPFRDLQITQNDNVLYSERPGQRSVDLVGPRTWTGKLKCAAAMPGDGALVDLESLAENNTLTSFSLLHNPAPGRTVSISGRGQLLTPAYSDDKGLDVLDADLAFSSLTPQTASPELIIAAY